MAHRLVDATIGGVSSLTEMRTCSQQEGWCTHARVTMASASEIHKLE